MPKKQHTEEQSIAAFKQQEAGDETADVFRKLGVSQATFYSGRSNMLALACSSCAS